MNSSSFALLGFLLGIRHALDADHVVAVTTIVAHQRSLWRAARVGASWGLGHTVTIVLIGGSIIAFRLVVSPRVGLAMEFAVALMLIGLGLWNLRGSMRGAPGAEPSDRRPFAIGMVHGMAGSAAVALLVVASVASMRWAMISLLLFGLGTVIGMMLVTAALAIPAHAAGVRFASTRRWLTVGSGVLSVALGLWLAMTLTGPDGLFSATPLWEPH